MQAAASPSVLQLIKLYNKPYELYHERKPGWFVSALSLFFATR